MKVLALPEVQVYLDELSHILYFNNYFGFDESAHDYVDNLWADIKTNLPYHLHKDAPEYFNRFGEDMKYAVFRKNKHTSWYIFFDEYEHNDETVYLIRYVSNNHVIAQYL